MPAQTPRTETVQTVNGTAIRTDSGWVWLCARCPVSAQIGLGEDAHRFDHRRWAESVDRTHYCWHKREDLN